jgi:hypothetical protein
MKKMDLTGRVFGRLMILQENKTKERKDGHTQWDCLTIVNSNSLKTGHTKSCGCYKTEVNITHGKSKSSIYYVWYSMFARCYRSTAKGFQHYGGRGITVCDRWHDFVNFYTDMGVPPVTNYSIDRINNDGNYCPENCRWATNAQQANNKRSNHKIAYKGEEKTLAEWEVYLGLPKRLISTRLQHGWDIETIFSSPLFSNSLEYRGEHKTRKEWEEHLGLTKNIITVRLNRGWSTEKALSTPIKKKRN